MDGRVLVLKTDGSAEVTNFTARCRTFPPGPLSGLVVHRSYRDALVLFDLSWSFQGTVEGAGTAEHRSTIALHARGK